MGFHDAIGLSDLDSQFEWTKIDFADGLLRREGGKTFSIGILVIQGKVLGVGDETYASFLTVYDEATEILFEKRCCFL